jgi:hypothetical protein
MNKKSKPEDEKKLSIYKLIEDYSNSILKYEKSFPDGEHFTSKETSEQK